MAVKTRAIAVDSPKFGVSPKRGRMMTLAKTATAKPMAVPAIASTADMRRDWLTWDGRPYQYDTLRSGLGT